MSNTWSFKSQTKDLLAFPAFICPCTLEYSYCRTRSLFPHYFFFLWVMTLHICRIHKLPISKGLVYLLSYCTLLPALVLS